MVVGETKAGGSIMDGIENTGDVRMHDHRLRLKQRFDIVRKLGQGTYGKVQLGINKKTGQEVAIKTIKKCKIETEADLIRIRREVQIMSSVRHPNIVHIYEVFENSEKMILVMEYCPGGELYDYLSQQKVLQEDEARRVFRQIATAVYYCHIHKICHRDLKLENVLLDETGSAKIADFGLSNVFKETSVLATFCGSPLYASPEIVKGTPYIGPEVDCWSLGVLLYTLVYGAMPFDGSNFKRLVKQISSGDYYEPKNPSGASSLIRDMLTVDPIRRADIAYICDHPWVNMGCKSSCLAEAEALAAETPVRLDLLLSLAPSPPHNTDKLLLADNTESAGESSVTDVKAMSVEPSNSAERRILQLVAEGGADAIKPSPTRTLIPAEKKKPIEETELVNSEGAYEMEKSMTRDIMDVDPAKSHQNVPESQSAMSVTMATTPNNSKDEIKHTESSRSVEKARSIVMKKLPSPQNSVEQRTCDRCSHDTGAEVAKVTEENEESSKKVEKANQNTTKPTPVTGSMVNDVCEQLERRASLAADATRNTKHKSNSSGSGTKWSKSQSVDRDSSENIRLQNIGVQPPASIASSDSGGSNLSLEEARRSLQNSMAALCANRTSSKVPTSPGVPPEQKKKARDTITSVLAAKSNNTKPVYRTEAILRIPDRRNTSRGASIERVIPIHLSEEEAPVKSPTVTPPRLMNNNIIKANVVPDVTPHTPPAASLARRSSSSSSGEPIKKSAREFIIPIAVEGVGYVTPDLNAAANAAPRHTQRRNSLLSGNDDTDDEEDKHNMHRLRRVGRAGRGGAGRIARVMPPHQLATASPGLVSSNSATASAGGSSGEEDDEEPFELLTADNLFSTLLQRVRALTTRLNGDDAVGGFPSHHQRNIFDNFQSPFFERRAGELRPRLPRGGTGGRARRVSRFLRPDFYDNPPDELPVRHRNASADALSPHRYRRDLDTQRVLKEIRSRRASVEPQKSQSATNWREQSSERDTPITWREPSADGFKLTSPQRCLSKTESPSNQYHNHDYSNDLTTQAQAVAPVIDTNTQNKRESKLLRPKSYPYGTICSKSETNSSDFNRNSDKPEEQAEAEPFEETQKSEINVSYNVNLKNKQIEENINNQKPKKKSPKKTITKSKPNDSHQIKKSSTEKDSQCLKKTNFSDNISNEATPIKKRSMLQSLGHKLEKLTSKTNSLDSENHKIDNHNSAIKTKSIRSQRESSVPLSIDAGLQSGNIHRASTLTNVANQTEPRRSVSRVFGLFRRSESKEPKPVAKESPLREAHEDIKRAKETQKLPPPPAPEDKPKRPASLFLNGLSRKKYSGAVSDSALIKPITEIPDSECGKGNVKPPACPFSRLPRFRQAVVQNSHKTQNDNTLAPSDTDGHVPYSKSLSPRLSRERLTNGDRHESHSPSSIDCKTEPNLRFRPTPESNHRLPHRQNEGTSPDREDIFDRIRRKSFYNRFNEQKAKRRSNLVGPGATEYNPTARLHAEPISNVERRYDLSPTSSIRHDSLTNLPKYDSPTHYDLDRWRNSATGLDPSLKYSASRYIPKYDRQSSADVYRSLDRKTPRSAYPYSRYADSEMPTYKRTMSLMDDKPVGMCGNSGIGTGSASVDYATYSPRRRPRNSVYTLKSEDDSPELESILERIKERKKAAAAAMADKQETSRSNIPRKSQSDRSECAEKVD